jgi:YedE family putative selenium metabolism protein
MGSVRDVILMRDTHLISGVGALVLVALVINLVLGQFKLGIIGQPVAHSNHVWNFLGMVLAGLAFALAGGCPGRQLFMSGEGDGDAALFVLGMLTGAAFAHNFDLAARPDVLVEGVLDKVGGPSVYGMAAVVIGLIVCMALGFVMREKYE